MDQEKLREKLSKIQCHFNWKWADCTRKSKLFLNDRIDTIEGTIKAELKGRRRNLRQLYALKGFLYIQLYARDDRDDSRFLNDAENCFEEALKEYGHEGYKAVIYGSLTHLFELKDESSKVTKYIAKYDEINKRNEVSSNAEAWAMQGHSAVYLHRYQEAINFYEMAIEMIMIPEWLFGLALAFIHKNVGRSKYSDMDRIESLLRHVILLDSTYDIARLKLANHIFQSRGEHAREEIKAIVDPCIVRVEQNQSNNVTLLEEAAKAICKLDSKRALELYEKCYDINKNSQNTLRGLGNCHLVLWNKNRRKKRHLDNAIKFLHGKH